MIIEMGILAPFLWILWTGALVYSSWGVVKRLRQTRFFPIAFAFFWYAFLLLFPLTYGGISAYQNFVCNMYLWIWVGILFGSRKSRTLRRLISSCPPTSRRLAADSASEHELIATCAVSQASLPEKQIPSTRRPRKIWLRPSAIAGPMAPPCATSAPACSPTLASRSWTSARAAPCRCATKIPPSGSPTTASVTTPTSSARNSLARGHQFRSTTRHRSHPAPLRRIRRSLRRKTPRHVCLRHLGCARRKTSPRARPPRHQAALLRRRWATN